MARPLLVPLLVVMIAATCLVTATGAPEAADDTPHTPAATRGEQAIGAAQQMLGYLVTRASSSDTQWFSDGTWFAADTSSWPSFAGPGTLAAELYVAEGRTDPSLLAEATSTFDTAIAAHEDANGLFGDPTLPLTQFFASELGATYLELGPSLDQAHQDAWRTALSRAADALIAKGELSWATNGNVNLGETFLMWEVAQITGEQRYRDAFEASWSFLLNPPQDRFPGFGLHLTKVPTLSDGSDGAGYLAEKGSGAPGYDPEYTMLQLSIADRGFVFSGDPRFRWLGNLLFNQLRPRIDEASWVIDTSNGSRRDGAAEGFFTPAPEVLALSGGRTDLLPLVDSALQQGTYRTLLLNARMNWGNPALYRAYGSDMSVALKVATEPVLPLPPVTGVTPPGVTTPVAPADPPPVTPPAAPATPAPPAVTPAPALAPPTALRAIVGPGLLRVRWKDTASAAGAPNVYSVLVDGAVRAHATTTDILIAMTPGTHRVTVVARHGTRRSAPATVGTVVVPGLGSAPTAAHLDRPTLVAMHARSISVRVPAAARTAILTVGSRRITVAGASVVSVGSLVPGHSYHLRAELQHRPASASPPLVVRTRRPRQHHRRTVARASRPRRLPASADPVRRDVREVTPAR